MKIFYTSKDTIIKGDGDIFANHKSDKSLISRVHKENLQLNNNKRTNNLTEKWASCLNKYFFKEDIQMVNKHMKICSISLIIMKMQKKITSHCDITPYPLVWKLSKNKQVLVKIWRHQNPCTLSLRM